VTTKHKMKIDLAALLSASGGDQSKKVTVSKAWLRAVHDELKRKNNLDEIGDRLERVTKKFGVFG